MGCPATDCKGYEPGANPDCDSDGDGDDLGGNYHAGGKGWKPIGAADDNFTGVVERNGRTIAHLFIERSSGHMGLVGNTGAALRRRVRR